MPKDAGSTAVRPSWAALGLSGALLLVASGAHAQTSTDAQIKALQQEIKQLENQVNTLAQQQAQSQAAAQAAQTQAAQAQAAAAAAAQQTAAVKAKTDTIDLDANGHSFLEHKKGSALTFYTPGGEITGYGNLDVSLDALAKNVGGEPYNNSVGAAPDSIPVGNWGWEPDISTNLSYFGIRGFQRLPDQLPDFVYQLEGGFEISAEPGLKESGSSESNQVNGALFSRNSFVGFSSPTWGALKAGKTDAPYKNSTASLNPFAGEIGDYSVIMGNSGGDNRVEFGTRLDHAIWYESPEFAGGFHFNFLFAPGQNRATDDSDLAAGESDCTGNDIPESGGDEPVACNDGSFGNAVSSNLSYTRGPLYLTAAGEWHQAVNRQSDITGMYGVASPTALPSAVALAEYDADVADEWATKVAAQYTFPTKTMVGGIIEYLHRDDPSLLQFQDERTRFGTWLVLGQPVTEKDNVFFGWAHAFRTIGDPGQHNDTTLLAPGSVPGADSYYATNQNQSDMLTLAWKHMLSENLTWYADWAVTMNGPSAHFDLGAGGRAVVDDCHDANSATGGNLSTPQCWTGQTLMGVSTGIQWKF